MNDLVVKANALINASYTLSLIEQRLILLAIVTARNEEITITDNRRLIVTASAYERQFSITRQAAYMALKDACNTLFERRFSFEEWKGEQVKQVKTRWVSQIAYVDDAANVEIIFAPAVIPLITELESRFTTYELAQVSGLSSAYAVRLYEQLIAWRKTGQTPLIELKDLRNKLGLDEGEYPAMSDFKKRVLELALAQINKHTDINANYKQYKSGRTITGFSFTFKFKKTNDKNLALGTNEENIPLPLATPKAKQSQEVREKTADLEHLKRLAELGGVPLESLLKRS